MKFNDRMRSHVASCHENERINACGCDLTNKMYSMVLKMCYQKKTDDGWKCVEKSTSADPAKKLATSSKGSATGAGEPLPGPSGRSQKGRKNPKTLTKTTRHVEKTKGKR